MTKLCEPLPKFRREEIQKKLGGELPTPTAQVASKTMPVGKKMTQEKVEDEFSKTLEPAKMAKVEPNQYYQNLLRMIKLLNQNQKSADSLATEFADVLNDEETLALLVKQRQVLTKALTDLIFKGKPLHSQKEQIVQIVELFKELILTEINDGAFVSVESLQEFVQLGLMLTDLQVEQEAGLTSQVLSLAADAVHKEDLPNFLELLRCCVEQPGIIGCQNASSIIQNVYLWLGFKLPDFIAAGMPWTEVEDLRSIGIKYLEATHLFTE